MSGKTLLIVESGAKAKTIEKLLGPGFMVKASFGHIRNLDDKSHNGLGIDVANHFEPNYVFLEKEKRDIIVRLREAIRSASRVLIASDEDREGEAIAWHIAQVFGIPLHERNRITFHEITKPALERAVRNPRLIDMNMVYSQQARQVIDKLVGYGLSPVLWKHVAPKLSAGRVQSVALKMIVQKEREVEEFQGRTHFRTTAFFQKEIEGALNHSFTQAAEARTFLEQMGEKKTKFIISAIDKLRVSKKPPPPFITSSIQQEAGCRLGISSKMVMNILQKLYQAGKITYHRTDSVALSHHAIGEIREYILDTFGSDYHEERVFRNTAKNAQEAHEAIRPTYLKVETLEDSEEEKFDRLERKMYELIWKRTIASQMSEAVSQIYTMRISIEREGHSPEPHSFIAKAELLVFDGYKRIYNDDYKGKKEKEEDEGDELKGKNNPAVFDKLAVGSALKMKSMKSAEKADQPPPRFSEAFMIKQMEKQGIGRPSTYATTIDTLLSRKYVEVRDIEGLTREGAEMAIVAGERAIEEKRISLKIGAEKKKLVPTSMGRVANDYLEQHFENIMDYQFTSQMELKLDEIAQNKYVWHNVVGEYYQTFNPIVTRLLERVDSQQLSITERSASTKRLLGQDGNGKNVYVYVARYGPVFQIGEDSDKSKRYVKMDTTKFDLESVTIDDYLLSARYPKLLGKYQENDVFLKKGPYGFYIQYNGRNYSLSPSDSPDTLTIEEVVPKYLLASSTPSETTQSITTTVVKELGKYVVKIGRYGPYVQYDKKIAKIPKNIVPADITKEICKELIEKVKSESKTTKNKKKFYAAVNAFSQRNDEEEA